MLRNNELKRRGEKAECSCNVDGKFRDVVVFEVEYFAVGKKVKVDFVCDLLRG